MRSKTASASCGVAMSPASSSRKLCSISAICQRSFSRYSRTASLNRKFVLRPATDQALETIDTLQGLMDHLQTLGYHRRQARSTLGV